MLAVMALLLLLLLRWPGSKSVWEVILDVKLGHVQRNDGTYSATETQCGSDQGVYMHQMAAS